MSIDAKIAEIMEESKLLGFVEEQEEITILEELGLQDLSGEELEDFMMSEEFEQLDELSKATLGSYIKKAHSDTGKQYTHEVKFKEYGDHLSTHKVNANNDEHAIHVAAKEADKRHGTTISKEAKKGIDTTYHGGDEDGEGATEVHHLGDTSGLSRNRSLTAHVKKLTPSKKTSAEKKSGRTAGIERAVSKLAKESFDIEDYSVEELEDFMMSEDFEQLDELNKNTVSKYLDKLHYKIANKVNPDGSLKQAGETLSDKRKKMSNLAASKIGIIGNYPAAKVKAVPDWKRKADKLRADKLRKESIDVSADVDALMFGESLSEEFREKAATIFESAVVVRVKEEVARLEEEFEEKLAEQVDSITEGLVEKIDGYLDYVVEQWIEQNEIALEHGLKSDIMESFITGMKGLFEEHYIDVPEEKYDVIGEMEAKIDTLESKLDEQFERNVELKKSLSESVRKEIVSMVSEGLTSTETEKFAALVEELSYDDEDSFKVKVQTIRENYFTGNSSSNRLLESVVTDSPVEEINESKYTNIDPTVAAYAQALKQYNN